MISGILTETSKTLSEPRIGVTRIDLLNKLHQKDIGGFKAG